ncbi:hypothetical protein V6N11_035557 [Hibiscus sabdariffa]|uniref:RNase H type-1 domain-containing protein n=2 Tax=Hibiscus sabdariffa TaxID=183260 RepID=A0ABR2R0R8_9ROSI
MKKTTLVKWLPVSSEWLKFNVDGTMMSDGKAGGIEGSLRNADGVQLLSFSRPIGTGSPVLVELSAVEFAVDMFLKSPWAVTCKLIVESDCSNVVCWILNPSKVPLCFISRFQAFSLRFLIFRLQISYVSRACNIDADSLVKRAISSG